MATKYLLFAFRTGNGKITITRGETREQAREFLTRICGEIIKDELDFNYCHAAYCYSINHPFNWLDNPPLWLNRNRKLEPHDFSFKNNFLNSAEIIKQINAEKKV